MRWKINRAAPEFGVDRRTLAKRLADAGEAEGAGGYTTRQILAALYGDLDGEKLRKLSAEADLAEMERDEQARALIRADIVEGTWNEALTNLRAIVMAADIPKVTRAQLIKQLHDIPIHDYREATARDGEDDSAEIA